MSFLNQVIAVEPSVRKRFERKKTELYKVFQKEALFSGRLRTYTPLDEEGFPEPAENQLVQRTVGAALPELADSLIEMMSTVATKDIANTLAKADIVLDGKVLAADVPVTHLLFIEKQMEDLKTIIRSLPILDEQFEWSESSVGAGIWETKPQIVNRTTKVPFNHVKYPATEQHPAQVDIFHTDKVIGVYNTILYSGAISGREKEARLLACEDVIKAVKAAREQANSMEIEHQEIASALIKHVLQ